VQRTVTFITQVKLRSFLLKMRIQSLSSMALGRNTSLLCVTIQMNYSQESFSSSNYQLNAQFLYSITIYTLHYNPQHVSSSTLLIFRRTNFIITASGIVTPCKRPYSMPVESGLQSTLELFQITNLMHNSFIL